jgi:ABC-type Mn2+/Zn2+ transport system ATPase subunit
VRYGPTVAVEHVRLRLAPGELVALVGPNGAGKSSLLRAVMGLVDHSGTATVHTRRAGTRGVAFVPQRADVDLQFPITVEQVVADGRRPFRAPWRPLRRDDRAAVRRALSTVGLDGLERRPISQLSGGQTQRAFIARALVQEADLLLLDEPLWGVDVPTASALVDLLEVLAANGRGILLSTHDLRQVRERFERCLVLNRRLVADGSPADVLGPDQLQALFFAHA